MARYVLTNLDGQWFANGTDIGLEPGASFTEAKNEVLAVCPGCTIQFSPELESIGA